MFKRFASLVVLGLCATALVAPDASARSTRDRATTNVVKQAAVGAAVGAGVGALSDRSTVLKGAGVGALVGTGTGLMDSSRALDGRPLVRSTLKGAAIGTGAGVLTDRGAGRGAAVGAAAGAGTHFVRRWLNND